MKHASYSEQEDDVFYQADSRTSFFPVTSAEVQACFLPLKSAARPDGFTGQSLRTVPVVMLQEL